MSSRRRTQNLTQTPSSITTTSTTSTTSTTTTTSPPSSVPTTIQSSPYLPKPAELLFLSLFPVLLLLGSLYATLSPHLSPSTLLSTYSAAHQSYQPPSGAPSYFARKSNLFNQYFVKLGWFWTAFALATFLATHPRHTTTSRAQSLLRFLTATSLWFLTTQWFFGPALIDRSFTLSGGACQLQEASEKGEARISKLESVLSNAECKLQGGTWSGGIDISGHVFLLVLGCSVLVFETLPFLSVASSANSSSSSLSKTKKTDGEEGRIVAEDNWITNLALRFVTAVIGLMLWMLLMTATYFHTWPEKAGGLLVAMLGVWTIYVLPRGIPALRSVLGAPGEVSQV